MWAALTSTASMGHTISGTFPSPNYGIQKRNFSLISSPKLHDVAPGKMFGNPNFVNKHFPMLHNYQSNFDSHCDSKENSSHVIIDTIKETCPNVIPPSPEREMCNRKKKNRRRKKPQRKNYKHNKNRQDLIERLDVETDTDFLDPTVSPQEESEDRLDINSSKTEINIPTIMEQSSFVSLSETFKKRQISLCESEDSFVIFDRDEENQDVEDVLSENSYRQRQTSFCESEDSFIIFDGSDQEFIEFSEDSEDNDSCSSVIENKKVKFADDSKLCEVHLMVKWAYAYQAARRGPWEEYARDRERFRNRIVDIDKKIQHIFKTEHRDRVFKERFDK